MDQWSALPLQSKNATGSLMNGRGCFSFFCNNFSVFSLNLTYAHTHTHTMQTQSPLAWFMFQSLQTGVIAHEWDLNQQAAGPVETRLLLWRAKETKAKM